MVTMTTHVLEGSPGQAVADYALITGVNLAGFFWLTQRAIAEMLKRHGGHVVSISATTAEVANSGTPAVLTALTKGGLAAATRSLAVEYASRGIRVNAISPGIIQTPAYPAESYAGPGDQLPPMGGLGAESRSCLRHPRRPDRGRGPGDGGADRAAVLRQPRAHRRSSPSP